MSRRTLLFGIIGALGLVAVAAGGWYFFLRADAPPPVTLEDAVDAVTDTTAATPDGATATTAAATPTTTATSGGDDGSTAGAVDGTGVVDPAPSFVGYRVGEELAGIGTTEAAGRTSDVTGGLTIDGSAITAVDVEANLTTLTSDDSNRDAALRTRGLETETFPTATFTLTSPIELGAPPAEGETISATAVGDLTLHGVTNSVELPIEGSLVDGGTIVVVGSMPVTMADYDIEPPTGLRVLSIEDVGTIELQLAFVRG
jgi:polyisoprenoid-binding protein YceI